MGNNRGKVGELLSSTLTFHLASGRGGTKAACIRGGGVISREGAGEESVKADRGADV